MERDRSGHEILERDPREPKGQIRECYFDQTELAVTAIVGDGEGPGATVIMECPVCNQVYKEHADDLGGPH
jgi:hypothetical protein